MPVKLTNKPVPGYDQAIYVDDDGVEKPAIVMRLPKLQYILTCKDAPKGQDDWKYYLRIWGGPMPSQVQLVEAKVGDLGNYVAVIWKLRGGG